MNVILAITLLCTFDIDAAIVGLRSDIRPKNLEITKNVLLQRSGKYGFSSSDFPLILAMIKKESNFAHIFGAHGEIGFLQVIPEDRHVMEVVSKIDCEPSEKFCSAGSPDVFTLGKLNSWKVRRFLTEHPHYALETGLGEMRFWKDKYDSSIKARFWTKFPTWYFRKQYPDFLQKETSIRWWWNNVQKRAGEYVWISHYNWGEKLLYHSAGRNYAVQVVEIMNSI